MNAPNISDNLAAALRALYPLVPFDGNHADETAKGPPLKAARDALADYEATQRQNLIIRVCGEPARMALCDVLNGWAARATGGAWHEIQHRGNPHHVRELIRELRIRGTVNVTP